MHFQKWQGCGNDFVLIDCMKEKIADYAGTAKGICNRHFGIGADGLIAVLPGQGGADFTMRIFNIDGSEAQMCGNGIRCFARYLYDNGYTGGKEFSVYTGAGIMRPKIIDEGKQVEVDMGEPILEGDKIPVSGFADGRVIEEPITVANKDFAMTCVSMGNPHCVVFVESAENCGIETLGTLFEHHERFPERINTEFAEVLARDLVRMRVWERGAAITMACGTGSCATLVAGVLTGRLERKATILLDGGQLLVEWREDNHVYMTGQAEFVFEGII